MFKRCEASRDRKQIYGGSAPGCLRAEDAAAFGPGGGPRLMMTGWARMTPSSPGRLAATPPAACAPSPASSPRAVGKGPLGSLRAAPRITGLLGRRLCYLLRAVHPVFKGVVASAFEAV